MLLDLKKSHLWLPGRRGLVYKSHGMRVEPAGREFLLPLNQKPSFTKIQSLFLSFPYLYFDHSKDWRNFQLFALHITSCATSCFMCRNTVQLFTLWFFLICIYITCFITVIKIYTFYKSLSKLAYIILLKGLLYGWLHMLHYS